MQTVIATPAENVSSPRPTVVAFLKWNNSISYKIHTLHRVAAHDRYLLAYELDGVHFVSHFVYRGRVRVLDVQEPLSVLNYVHRRDFWRIVFHHISLRLLPELFGRSALETFQELQVLTLEVSGKAVIVRQYHLLELISTR